MGDKPIDLEVHKATEQQLKVAEAKNALKEMEESFDEIVAYQKIVAKLRHNKFQSLVDAGFSRAEALLLINNEEVV